MMWLAAGLLLLLIITVAILGLVIDLRNAIDINDVDLEDEQEVIG